MRADCGGYGEISACDLDELVRAKQLAPERRRGAELMLWSSIHGLAVFTNTGALREPLDAAFDRLFRFVMPGLEHKSNGQRGASPDRRRR